MKVMIVVLTFVVGFSLGKSQERTDDSSKYRECSVKVQAELTEKRKNKNWDNGIKALPFDILYHYLIGKTEACVKDWK